LTLDYSCSNFSAYTLNGGKTMRFLIKFEVFESITGDAEVNRVRKLLGPQIQQAQNSGKLVDGGMFGDQRGGFMVVDLDKPSDFHELLGGAILDNCHVESHPVLSFEELGEFFKKHPVGE
jgi:hypothetical protein